MYSNNIYFDYEQDYEVKKSAYQEANIRSTLFDQLTHEISSPAMELRFRLKDLKAIRANRINNFEEHITIIESLIEQISGLIEAFKEYRVFEPYYKDEETDININNVISYVILSIKTTLQPNVKFQLDLCQNPIIRANNNALYHVFRNLLKNSIEATIGINNPRILIKTSIIANHNSNQYEVQVIIQDNGNGISEKDLPFIFNDKYTTKHETGHGHGLTITKKLISRYKGTIRVNNKNDIDNNGACFELKFPCVLEK